MQGHLNLPKRIHHRPRIEVICRGITFVIEPIPNGKPMTRNNRAALLKTDPFELKAGESMLFYGNSTETKKF
jgi:hypothetical protein